MKRVESLDYLRGIMALSVMFYHYITWGVGELGGESFLGKLGIYAVSIFYILSGLSLALVYQGRIKNGTDIKVFFIKRVFRIFPLFWLTIIAFLLLRLLSSYLKGEEYEFPVYTMILNFSLLFGFIDPSKYLTTGAWSIGNEMVFYALFPVVFIIAGKHRFIIISFLISATILGLYFAFYALNNTQSLGAEQWDIYINPFNQLYLFAAGVFIGIFGKRINCCITSTKVWYFILSFSFLVFYFLPAQGDSIGIVTGLNRVILSTACTIFVCSLYIINPEFKGLLAKILSFFGQGCYSIYLLHPIVVFPVIFVAEKLGISKFISYSLAVLLTLFISWVTFNYLEKPMMVKGKEFANNFK